MNRHTFRKRVTRLSLVIFSFWLTISIWQSPIVSPHVNLNNGIRGVWITNYGTALSYFTTRLDEVNANLAEHHINTVYPAVWNRGATLYSSKVVKAAGGPSRNQLTSLPLLPFQNPLGSFIHHAHRQHLRIIPWFEYGLWVPASSAIAKAHPDWLTTTVDGNITTTNSSNQKRLNRFRDLKQEWAGSNQAWLNPAHPDVQTFFTQLVLEVVENYDVDGIQLDDHFGIPVEFGYDDYTVQKYKASHQGQDPPRNPNNPEWVAWRAAQLTQLMTKLSTEVRSQHPNIIISLSPSPPNFAYEKYLQNWTQWANQKLVDEVLVQIYRDNPSFIQSELDRQDFYDLRNQIPIGIGLYTGPIQKAKPITQIQQEIDIVQNSDYDDLAFFSWETTFWWFKKSSSKQVKAIFQNLFPVTLGENYKDTLLVLSKQ